MRPWNFLRRLFKGKSYGERMVKGEQFCEAANIMSRSAPSISYFRGNYERDCVNIRTRLGLINPNIGPQLSLSGIFRPLNQVSSGNPKAIGIKDKQTIEKREQPFRRVVEESVVPLMLGGSIGFGFFILWLGDHLRDQGRKRLANAIVLGGLFVAGFGWLFIVLLAAFLDGRL